MDGRQITEPVAELRQVAERFAAWRRTRTKRGRIPGALWDAAACAARRHGAGQVAMALRISRRALAERMASAVRQPGAQGWEPPGCRGDFVELIPDGMGGAAPGRASVAVEVERADGARLRLQGMGDATVAAVVAAFMRGG